MSNDQKKRCYQLSLYYEDGRKQVIHVPWQAEGIKVEFIFDRNRSR